jgi:5-formyltetrahydrofolate cyclo-ligase
VRKAVSPLRSATALQILVEYARNLVIILRIGKPGFYEWLQNRTAEIYRLAFLSVSIRPALRDPWFFYFSRFLKMQPDIQAAKALLRKQIRDALQNISPAARNALSAQIRDQLKKQAIWKNAGAVLFFAPLPDELDLWPLLEEALAAGKIAALPRFNPAGKNYVACRVQNLRSEIAPGEFGIREPAAWCAGIPLDRLDLILVPGVAFDWHGHRLGRGRGFYDRLLTDVRGVKCGITFDEQMVNDVPAGPPDVRMNFILTPTRAAEIAG